MGNKLYVGNLPYSATNESLQAAFAECGTVESARIVIDRESGRSKGFGFVEMSTPEEAKSSIARFDGCDWDGRAMKVNEARPMEPRDSGARRGGNSRW